MANVRRTSLNLDFELVERAQKALGTSGTTETVHRALEEAWRRDALEHLSSGGSTSATSSSFDARRGGTRST